MCRYDDDWAWLVMSTDLDRVEDGPVTCEDCSRTIAAGEPHVHYVTDATGGEEDDRPLIFAVLLNRPTDMLYDDDDYLADDVILAIDDETVDAWEALGFVVSELKDPRLVNEYIGQAKQCRQCYEANQWLVKVCDQHSVLVTREDLAEHETDYDEATLGPHFLAMTRACQNGWRHRHGAPMAWPVVRRLAHHAVTHARASGMVD